jgi:uncharacterized DUF497 family protein
MVFDWNEEKNYQLKKERNISFERIVLAIEDGCILDVLEHPNKEKYKNQVLIIIDVGNYAYVVPAVKEEGCWFLKTIFPSRKYTEQYLPKVRRNK